MKKLILPVLALAVFLVSCKKDSHKTDTQPITKNEKKYAVKFAVNEFSQTVTGIGSLKTGKLRANSVDTALLTNKINQYFYVVYNAAGEEIRRILRYAYAGSSGIEYTYHNGPDYIPGSGAPGLKVIGVNDPYNVITDSLAAGTYSIVVTGTNSANGIWLNNPDDEFPDQNPVYSSYADAVIYEAEGLDPLPRSVNLFFGKVTAVVGNQDITQSLTVNRVVGQLEVNLEDAIPNNVAYIRVGRQGEKYGYKLKDEIPFGDVEYLEPSDILGQTVADDPSYPSNAEKGTTNYKMYRYIFNTVNPINIILEARDVNNKLLFKKNISNVQFYKNRKTILSGKLFNNTTTDQFSITANQAWGPDTPTIHF